jgi:hypothetical protein
MGVKTSEVGYTSAITERGDHEIHKGHFGGIGKKTLNKVKIKFTVHYNVHLQCTVHYNVHLQCTLSLSVCLSISVSLVRMKVRNSDVVAWVGAQRKISQVLGAFGLLNFTMLRPVLAWRAF